MFPFVARPHICPSPQGHQAEEPRRSQGHRCKEYRHLLTRSAEPQTAFSVGPFPSLRFWQAGTWQRVRGASTSLRQNTSEPNPRLCDRPFDFHVTASLLGTIATAFCRGSQLERPSDVICEGNRRISAVQAPSSSAHPLHGLSQFHMSRFAMCMMQIFGVVIFAASGVLRSAAVAS